MQGLYNDLTYGKPDLRLEFEQAKALSVDDFAEKYAPSIKVHYKNGGYEIDGETCYQAAADLWGFLRNS